jgi:diadenosine tetraphosphate (Ap4A) HIT family hydrolase
MGADKMNLASLGNQTPHVHWHVVPRFRDDRHFPGPIWATPKRAHAPNPERERRSQGVAAAVVERLRGLK